MVLQSIEYDITVQDYLAKLDRFTSRSPIARYFTWFAYFMICGLAWLSAILFYVKQGHSNQGYLVAGVFALLITLTLPALYKWYQKSFWSSMFTERFVEGIVGRKILSFDDQELKEVGEKVTLVVRWCDVVSVEKDAVRVWLIISPLINIVVPISAFSAEEQLTTFMAECQQRLRIDLKKN